MATITDPINNFFFEVHQYFDSDSSGTAGERRERGKREGEVGEKGEKGEGRGARSSKSDDRKERQKCSSKFLSLFLIFFLVLLGRVPACVSSTIGSQRLREFTTWCRQNGKRALLGEVGAGNGDDCLAAIDDAMV